MMTCCSRTEHQGNVILETTRSAYSAYMKWGQEGFPTPLPENLESLLTVQALEKISSDAQWFGGTGVRLHGDLQITDIKLLTMHEKHAVVQVTANDDNVTFTVDGKPRKKLKNDTRTSKVKLVYDKTWKIETITETEAHTSPSK